MKVKDLIARAAQPPVTIAADRTLYDAMRELVERKIGSLIVVDGKGAPVGIITERDIFRAAYAHRGDIMKTRVVDKMTTKLIVGVPEDEVDYIAGVITQNRIRHVPIVDRAGLLIGIVSIGDIVKVQLSEAEVHVRYLTEYITGRAEPTRP
jgi:CBS domain-containing protein